MQAGIGAVEECVCACGRGAERLRRAHEMAAIGSLTGGMAHDFNNLLGIITLSLELARERATGDRELGVLIGEALEAASHGAELTKRLLALARRQPLQPVRVDINHVLAGTFRLLRRLLGEDIEVKLNLGDAVWPVMVDAALFEASITNLSTNARDAMPRGGTLSLATANRRIDRADADGMPAGSYVMIEVSDTGIGMAPGVAGRIFEPFFTTKATGKGSGLGLSMVFGFIEQSGGHITVRSDAGIGTTFRLYLPSAADAGCAEARSEPVEAAAADGEHVPVVEDNVAAPRAVLSEPQPFGNYPITAGSARGLDRLAAETAGLRRTGLVMPGSAGAVELARAAAGQRPGTKAVPMPDSPERSRRADRGIARHFRTLGTPYSEPAPACAAGGDAPDR
jgi:hypothetical protein